METQYERRIVALEQQISESCATVRGLRLALDEANRQIAELTQMLDEATRTERGKKRG